MPRTTDNGVNREDRFTELARRYHEETRGQAVAEQSSITKPTDHEWYRQEKMFREKGSDAARKDAWAAATGGVSQSGRTEVQAEQLTMRM
jgi:hypothetical protein